MMSLLIIFAFIFVFAPIAQAYARRMNQPQLPGASPADVARLREEMDQLTAEVSRLREEHSFMVRLLGDGEERPSADLPHGRPASRTEPSGTELVSGDRAASSAAERPTRSADDE